VISAGFAIAFHGAIATLMLHWQQPAGASVPVGPIMIELTPVEQTSTSAPQADAPAAPEQTQDNKLVENIPTPPVKEPILTRSNPL